MPIPPPPRGGDDFAAFYPDRRSGMIALAATRGEILDRNGAGPRRLF